MESPPTGSWSESAREYDSFEKKWHFYATVAGELVRSLQLRPSSRVLELASGTGVCTSILAGLCPNGRVTGLDLSEEMVEVARQNVGVAGFSNVRFVCGDAQKLAATFGGESFDVAVCNSAFWHFPDGEAVLKGLRELLTGPGQFGMSLPSWRVGSPSKWVSYRGKIRELLLKHGADPESVERRFGESEARRKDISALLRNSGFTLVKDRAFQFEFPAEAREQWRSIPVFASLPTRRGQLFSNLDPSAAAKAQEELLEWRKQNLPNEQGVSRWRILVASMEASSE